MDMAKRETKDPLPGDITFAANVKKLRERRGWSMNDLAQRLREEGLENFHPTTVSRIESGQRAVRVGELPAFEKALASSMGYMLQAFGDAKLVHDLLLQMQEFQASWSAVISAEEALLRETDALKEVQDRLADTLRELKDHWEQVEVTGWGKGIEPEVEGAESWSEFDVAQHVIETVRSRYGVDK